MIGVLLPASTLALNLWAMPRLEQMLPWLRTPIIDRATVMVLALGPLVVAAVMLGKMVEGRPPRLAVARLGLAVLWGLFLGVGAFIGAVALSAAQGRLISHPGHLTLVMGLAAGIVMLFQCAAEEVFFRGWMLPVIAASWGRWIGVVVTSVVFSGLHAIGREFGLLSFLNDTLAGVLMAILALRTGGLTAPIAAHFGWNLVEGHILGLYPNPGVDGLESWFDFDLTGPDLWTGGAFAMNGALSVTLTLILAVGLAANLGPRSTLP